MGAVAMSLDTAQQDRRAAYALLRLFLGVDIAMHGTIRLAAAPAFRAHLMSQFAASPLPCWALSPFAFSLPWAEALIGVFLLFGLRTRVALVAGALLMALLAFGSGLVLDWYAAGVQLLYALVYAVLLFLRSYNAWSLDGLIANRRSRRSS
jgi:thiosulfate dehydrogenase (quinone) large subunit